MNYFPPKNKGNVNYTHQLGITHKYTHVQKKTKIVSWIHDFKLKIVFSSHDFSFCTPMCMYKHVCNKFNHHQKKKKNFMLGVAIFVSSRFHVVSSHEYSNIWVNLNLTCLVNMFGILNPHTISLLNRSIWHDSFNSFN